MIDPRFPIPFSVLISVYARERPEYLALALESLVHQTAAPDQVVVVCDGPLGPGLDGVIEHYAATLPLDLVRLPENRGLSHALNAGLPHCRHEWIARFDSDDICESSRFATQLRFIAGNPDIDVFGANIVEFTADGLAPHAVRRVPTTHDEIARMARWRNPMNHVTVFFRKSVVERAGGYPGRALNEDYALWVELLSTTHRFANIDEPLVRVRAGREMVSRRGGRAYLLTEMRLQNHFLKSGFIGIGTYLFNVGVRIAIRLAPGWFRQWVYSTVLRRRPSDQPWKGRR